MIFGADMESIRSVDQNLILPSESYPDPLDQPDDIFGEV